MVETIDCSTRNVSPQIEHRDFPKSIIAITVCKMTPGFEQCPRMWDSLAAPARLWSNRALGVDRCLAGGRPIMGWNHVA